MSILHGELIEIVLFKKEIQNRHSNAQKDYPLSLCRGGECRPAVPAPSPPGPRCTSCNHSHRNGSSDMSRTSPGRWCRGRRRCCPLSWLCSAYWRRPSIVRQWVRWTHLQCMGEGEQRNMEIIKLKSASSTVFILPIYTLARDLRSKMSRMQLDIVKSFRAVSTTYYIFYVALHICSKLAIS